MADQPKQSPLRAEDHFEMLATRVVAVVGELGLLHGSAASESVAAEETLIDAIASVLRSEADPNHWD